MGYNIPLIETSCRFNCEILLYTEYIRHSYFNVFAADSKYL